MKRILIVDDDPDFLELLKERLSQNLYEISTAANGVAALAALEDSRPDLIILDVLMPYLDGKAFVNILKKHDKFTDIPIIIYSARFDMQSLFDEEDIKHYFTKTDPSSELLDKIKTLLGT